MSKKSRNLLRANLYENDYEYFEEINGSTKIKHIETKSVIKNKTITEKPIDKDIELKNKVFGGKISDKEVPCKCNKCGTNVHGVLISTIYSPGADLVTPFISYDCPNCKHSGFRSVKEKSLPATLFDSVYF